MERNLQTAELTNPGVLHRPSVNTQALEGGAARKLLRDLERQFSCRPSIPC